MRNLIAAMRSGILDADEGTALYKWAWHRNHDGEQLPPQLAGIELQNSIRPMIAVARFVAFAAKELHDRPEWRMRIAAETAERAPAWVVAWQRHSHRKSDARPHSFRYCLGGRSPTSNSTAAAGCPFHAS